MSIQEAKLNQLGVSSKLFMRAINRCYLLSQHASRACFHDEPRVFYPYDNLLGTHPFFLRFNRYPPLRYSNLSSAQLLHLVNFNPNPNNGEHLPYVIEPNDHPLAPAGKSEPGEVLSNFNRALETYENEKCKKIMVEGEGQLNLFRRYFSKSVIRKTEILRLGAIPRHVNFEDKFNTVKTPVFVCLASDYKRKAVDLVLNAWVESQAKLRCRLLLACPNVPECVRGLLEKENVKLISKAPLSEKDKFDLYSNAHVVIAPLHTDGGANILEGFEFGLPAITMRSQRSFIRGNNGWEIDVPFYFYDEGYGKDWPTWDAFWAILDQAKINHLFDNTIEGFVDVFNQIAESPEILLGMGKSAYELAKGEFSLRERNAALKKIYEAATC